MRPHPVADIFGAIQVQVAPGSVERAIEAAGESLKFFELHPIKSKIQPAGAFRAPPKVSRKRTLS
jgi:hypothetical protein